MRLPANGIALEVIDRGSEEGFALVFLHYFGGSSRAWSGVIDRLQAEYRCIAPDLRGFGRSDAPGTGYAIGDYADDAADLIRGFDLARYALVGHSMGGKVALALAARLPRGLEALVLLAPSPPTPEPIGEAERRRLIASHGDRAAARDSARKITALPLDDVMLDLVADDAVRSSRQAWLAWLEIGSREDISPMMSGVAVPVLVVAGASDPHLPAELLEREVVQPVANARMVRVPDAGHLLPIEAPAAVARLIRAQACN
ncbi:MAG: alpha/beta fold hydrolase [Gemmatimonadales bacterium]|nr:alpha/beta fold hydrolase [Gemmatimonadales bacterium]MDQ3428063.1 alpha/beta hydrolase [Gemmatimonadota bacterium]